MSVALNNIQSVDRGEDEKVRSYIKRSLKKKKQEKNLLWQGQTTSHFGVVFP